MKKTALIAAAFAAISTVAMAVLPANATAIGEIEASAYAGTELLRQQSVGRGKYIPHPKDGYIGGRKVGPQLVTPKICFERKRVGPQTYVTVRRAC